MNRGPKKIPTLRDSKDSDQLDIFQREVREAFRLVDRDNADVVTNITNILGGVGAVNSVTAGSNKVTVTPTTGDVVIDVVPGNLGLIDEVVAGTNLSGGGTSGSVTLNVVDSPSFAGNVTLGDTSADAHTVNGILNIQNLRGKVQTVTSLGSNTVTLNADTTVLRFNGSGLFEITGMTGGAEGRFILMQNISSGFNVLTYHDNALSTAADRFWIDASGGFRSLWNQALNMALAVYDSSASRWRVVFIDTQNTSGALIVNGNLSSTSTTSTVDLSVSNNATIAGTLTLSPMTAGSVLFAGASGLVSQDNARLFWDDASNRLGIGMAVPATVLHVRGTGGSSGLTPVAGTVFTVENTASDNNISLLVGTANSQGIIFGNTTSVVDGGVHYSSARTMQLRTGGNNTRVTILSTGEVGIGDTSPTNALTVTGAGSATLGWYTNESRTIGMNESGTTLQWRTNNLDAQMTLDSGANLFVKGNATLYDAAGLGIGLSMRSDFGKSVTFYDLLGTTPQGQVSIDPATPTLKLSAGNSGAVPIDRVTINGSNGLVTVLYNFQVDGNATLGNSTSSDAHTINGALSATRAPSGSTVTANALALTEAGTFDTTTGVLISRGANIAVTSTRSAGANDLVNYALELNASGAQQNQALRTGTGDNLLNVTSGNTGIGTSPTTTSKMEVAAESGKRAATMLNARTSQTASTNNLRSEITGSYNTTAGLLQAIAVVGSATSTRSAGANNLENYGGVFTATSAQVNRALQTNEGDVLLNNTSGNTGVGISPAVKFHVAAGASSGLATSLTGTVAVIEQTNGTADYLQFRSNTTAGLAWAGAGSGGDGKLIYDQSINAMQFATANTFRAAVLSTGRWQFGDTSGSSVDSDVDVIEVGNTGTGQTATDKALLRLTHSGSFNTTAGAKETWGLYSSVTATRSAGSNDLTNRAALFTASGAQVNVAIMTEQGDNQFNTSSGKSTFTGNVEMNANVNIGNAAGDTIKFHGGTGATQQTITGSRGGNAALASLLTALGTLGLIVDSSTA